MKDGTEGCFTGAGLGHVITVMSMIRHGRGWHPWGIRPEPQRVHCSNPTPSPPAICECFVISCRAAAQTLQICCTGLQTCYTTPPDLLHRCCRSVAWAFQQALTNPCISKICWSRLALRMTMNFICTSPVGTKMPRMVCMLRPIPYRTARNYCEPCSCRTSWVKSSLSSPKCGVHFFRVHMF